jgi:hypothetical protein
MDDAIVTLAFFALLLLGTLPIVAIVAIIEKRNGWE